jgi:putative acetyltransferase
MENPKPKIIVRAREGADLDAITMLMGCPGVVRGTLQLPLRSLDERREQYARRAPGTHSLVAEIDRRVVGQLSLHVEQNPRRRHVGSIGMAVHDDFQGRGVGSALLTAILDLADRWLALRRIELEVYTDNAAAIGLYEKFGFVREGQLRDYAFRDGGYIDALFMARVLP